MEFDFDFELGRRYRFGEFGDIIVISLNAESIFCGLGSLPLIVFPNEELPRAGKDFLTLVAHVGASLRFVEPVDSDVLDPCCGRQFVLHPLGASSLGMKAESRNAIVRGGRGLVGIEERSDLGLFDRGGNLDLVLSVENRET